MSDLVSVIMPSYNTAEFIRQAIDSVMAQTYENWELIIVDDHSTDDTDAMVALYTDDRIRYIKNETNSGAAISRNRALREAKGRWIAFLDSDDLWMPHKLEDQIRFMEQTGCHFSYTAYEEIDERGNVTGVTVRGPKHIDKADMYRYCWPGCLTVMYDARMVGLIQIEDIKKNNDYAMWLEVIRKTPCCLLDQVLSQYRKRSSSIGYYRYVKLIKWHYRLFRNAEKEGLVLAIFHTLQNLLFGVWKKVHYVYKKADKSE